jgi:hypothetical protein
MVIMSWESFSSRNSILLLDHWQLFYKPLQDFEGQESDDMGVNAIGRNF